MDEVTALVTSDLTTVVKTDQGEFEQIVSPTFVIFAIVIETLLMVLICGTNGMVLVAFRRTPQLRTITNYYIIQMAVADFSVGLWMPFHILVFAKPQIAHQSMELCTLRYAGLLLSFSASCMSLLAMTYDRLSSILWPLHYYNTMTFQRYLLCALFVWVWPVVMAIVAMAWHNEWEELPVHDCDLVLVLKVEYIRFITLPVFGLITVALVTMYIVIFHAAQEQAKREPPLPSVSWSQPQPASRFHKEMKLLKTGLIIFCVFYFCWIPLVLVIMLQVCYTPILLTTTLTSLRSAATFPAILNSALNPLVYAFRLPLFKVYIRKVIPCFKQKVANNDTLDIQPSQHNGGM